MIVGVFLGIVGDHYGLFPRAQFIAIKRIFIEGSVLRPTDWPTQNPFWKERAATYDKFRRQVDIVMIGDSRMNGGEWQEVFPNVRVASRGIGGDTTYGVLSRLGGIKKTGARTALIMVGINDILGGRKVEEVLANYRQILATLKQFGMRVVIQSTVQTNGRNDDKAHHEKTNSEIRKLNAGLRQIAEESGTTFVDLDGLFSNSQGLNDELTTDGIHFNSKGYDLWYKCVDEYMKLSNEN